MDTNSKLLEREDIQYLKSLIEEEEEECAGRITDIVVKFGIVNPSSNSELL